MTTIKKDVLEKKNMQSRDFIDVVGDNFEISRGHPFPLGATLRRGGINFAVFSRHASSVSLALFMPEANNPIAEFPLDGSFNRTGDIWHAFIRGLDNNIEYVYRVEMKDNNRPQIHRFDPSLYLVDPYAKAISGGEVWGKPFEGENTVRARRSLVIDDDFDWGFDQPLNIPLSESIIYELHVRGFTRHHSAETKYPGTYAGLMEKIPYLQKLGITAVELLPINEFEEYDTIRVNPETGQRLLNYWGYHSISFFAPKASYSSNPKCGEQVREFKELVKAMHEAGIEVILDIVFNHTAEGDERGPTISFRGFDNSVYYLIDNKTGAYHNYSGCGNTMNCNHPVVRDLILECLRYWVMEMHIDGFRFDLASILGRGRDGSVLANPPLLERIAADPILSNTKIIAEAWDAAGLYQVGTFPAHGRWAEWNGKFRDDIRKFVKGEPNMVSLVSKRLVGSPDIYHGSGRDPYHSINFITCHDGFTLADLVSYNEKHNDINGENSQDGCNDNYSWNCGVEGPVEADSNSLEKIESLRRRQLKNLANQLLLSRGVPMILAGDEMGRTQKGNNNAYCQDNEISWINWNYLDKNPDIFRFFRLLIDFRKRHPSLRHSSFNDDKFPIIWHGVEPYCPDWSSESRNLAIQIFENDIENPQDIYIVANNYWKPLRYELPRLKSHRKWYRKIDTSLGSPRDILGEDKMLELGLQESYDVNARTTIVLIGKNECGD